MKTKQNSAKDLLGFYKNKRVLVTGSSGFKGSWLCLFLSEIGAEVYGVDIKLPNKNPLNILNSKNFFELDINDFEKLKACVLGIRPDVVFHLAAKSITINSYSEPLQTFQTNVMGTANLLETLRGYKATCNAIIITSDKTYENKEWMWGYRENDTLGGKDPYSASKSAIEMLVKSYHESFFLKEKLINVATCRAGNVIGGADWNEMRIIPDCMRAWIGKEAVTLRNPNSIRPWNYINDVLFGYLCLGSGVGAKELAGEAFNFGPGSESEINVLKLVQILWENWENKDFEPIKIVSNENQLFEHTFLKLNCDKAHELIGWRSKIGVREALKETANWYQINDSNPASILDHSKSLIQKYLVRVGH